MQKVGHEWDSTFSRKRHRKSCWLYKLVKIGYSPNGGSVLWMEYLKHYICSLQLTFPCFFFRYKEKAKGSPDSQLIVIGSLSPALPWILRNAHKSEDNCSRETIEYVKCTHPTPALIPFIDMYSRLLHAVINGRDLKQEVMRVLSHSELGGPQRREQVLGLLDRASR